MPEDLSTGETSRSIQRIEKTLEKLDGKVDGLDDKLDNWQREVIDLKHQSAQNTRDIAELKAARTVDAGKQESRRWMVYLALITAALAFLSQFYFASRGA